MDHKAIESYQKWAKGEASVGRHILDLETAYRAGYRANEESLIEISDALSVALESVGSANIGVHIDKELVRDWIVILVGK